MKTTFTILGLALAAILVISCNSNQNKMKSDDKTVKAIDLADLDTNVSPADDFYQYATGGWQKSHPLPDEESRFGAFDLLAKETNQKVNDLITGLTEKENAVNSIEWKIATFYSLGMDTARIEKDGFKPVDELLKDVESIETHDDVLKSIADFHRKGISTAFVLFGSADSKDSKMEIAYLYQGGLGLPNRDYYTSNDSRSQEIRAEYKQHIAKMFTLYGEDKGNAQKIADKIIAFEHKLAEVSMTNLELRDPYATTNRMKQDEIKKLSPDFNFDKYFELIGLPKQEIINVSQPEFFETFSKIFSEN
jgi:putative endopeptidase